ncbi:Lrp/AsnC ligand binding domain-containing protein [Mobilicoccus caccae]|uniref:AsnC family transcriptional regulator n=1 Tax=Mobilicoccus caccae TaxID=1859295 RepID=A0ABQ6IR56_9MICO|nr:Lrp/AsnC ligand binding domain-containing protein [Mobilicoccus caccae]GMA40415.1 AsnC family transcriptional regulator [Mobilicoccus caccae]
MVQAYVLIQTEVGKSSSVAESIRQLAGVVATDEVTGPYDIICKLEAGSVEDLGMLVLAKVQEVSGITRTLTCTVVHA